MNQHIHCCDSMYNITATENDKLLIIYESDIRRYDFIMHEKTKRPSLSRKTGYYVQLLYCPWCGTELPKDLEEEWGNALEEEHGLTTDDFWDKEGRWDESKIPAEFRTDEWWKKRGL